MGSDAILEAYAQVCCNLACSQTSDFSAQAHGATHTGETLQSRIPRRLDSLRLKRGAVALDVTSNGSARQFASH